MTEFETKAITLLQSIDESLKVLKEAALNAEAKREANLAAASLPPEMTAAQGAWRVER